MSTDRLLDVERKERRRSVSKALVPLGAVACPLCDQPYQSITTAMPALFRHGGHGATRTATRRYCVPCGYDGGGQTTETNPRKL